MEKIPSWIELLLLPKLSAIEGEIKAVNTRIDAMDSKFDSLEKRLPMIEELTALKIRIADIEKRLAAA